MKVILFSALLPLLLVLNICGAPDSAWSQFRGRNSSGVAVASQPPAVPGPEALAWKTATPTGLSSPVLSRGEVFVTGLETGRLVTLALDLATGKQLWRRVAPEVALERVHSTSHPASSTPCVDDDRVFVYFGSYGLLCYDREGREQWKKPIPTPKTLYGMATSPILHGEHVILVLDNDANLPESKLSQSRVVAFKKINGEVAWESARPLLRSGWSTPAIWRHDGGEDLVVLGSGRVCGYDPKTGAEKWFATGFARETIVQPVFGNGLVYVSSAMGGVADERPDPEPLWKAVLRFDANGDARLARSEMTHHFTFPFRPEVPVEHPGFGLPLPQEPTRRKERQNEIFGWVDKDRDGFWTREEFDASTTFRSHKPKLLAIRPGGRGDVTDTHVAWTLARGIPEIPTPLFLNGRLYLVRNGGILSVVDTADGKTVYDERLDAAGQYSASPVAADGHIYLVSNPGVITVVKAGGSFEKIHRHDLKEPALVTPAFDANTLYVRTESHLWAFRARAAREVTDDAAAK